MDISRLTDAGCYRNPSELFRKLLARTCRATYNCRETEIVTHGDELGADLSHPAKSNDSDLQWLHCCDKPSLLPAENFRGATWNRLRLSARIAQDERKHRNITIRDAETPLDPDLIQPGTRKPDGTGA